MPLTPEGNAAHEEHAVLLEWEDAEPPLDFIFEAEDNLAQILESSRGLGDVDGNEVGNGSATIYLYGPDCEALWSAIESTVRALEPPPTKATIRQ